MGNRETSLNAKCRVINAYIKKKCIDSTTLTLHPKELEKERQTKLEASRRKK